MDYTFPQSPHMGMTLLGDSAWTPLLLSSLNRWLDASDTSTVTDAGSGKVSQWADKSGNNLHVSCSAGTNRPVTGTTTINSLNTINFGNGSAQFLSPDGAVTGDGGLDSQNCSIFMVYKQSTTASQGAPISMRSVNGGDSIIPDFNTLNSGYYPGAVGTYQIETPTSQPRGSAYIIGLNMTASDVTVRGNGTEILSLGAGQASDSFDRLVIGYRVGSSRLWLGEIAEVIIAGGLSLADIQLVEGYLSNKWGV